MHKIETIIMKQTRHLGILVLVAVLSSVTTFALANIHPVTKTHATGPNLKVRQVTVIWNSFSTTNTAEYVDCPPAKISIGGGVDAYGNGNGWIARSQPIGPGISGASGDVTGNTSNITGWEGI